MKIRITTILLAALLSVGTATTLLAQGSAFTYQGRLNFNGAPAHGSYDLRFIPFSASDGGSQAGPILTNRATMVSDGLFTVFLDFGDVSFLGTNYWLEIAVRTNGTGGFVTLSPRQPITPVPQAMASATAITALGLAGVVQNNSLDPGSFATVGGGFGNTNGGYGATIGGGELNLVGKEDDYATVAGGLANLVLEDFGTVGGGRRNRVTDDYATVAGGEDNLSGEAYATIGGGYQNVALGAYASLAGGYMNVVSNASYATVGGGFMNVNNGLAATVAGGFKNTVGDAEQAVVGGGLANKATNRWATVPGGNGNIAGGEASFAAGRNAYAPASGSFVWNSFNVRNAAPQQGTFAVFTPHGLDVEYGSINASGVASRHVTIGDFFGVTIHAWNGATLTDAGVWSNASDKNRKTDFQDVDPRAILERVAALPVRRWRYTNEDAGVKHLGPTAQEFQEAFGLGTDDKGIGTVDADGVALAAIQGLNLKLNDQGAENAELKRELATMKALIESLRQRLEADAR